MTTRVASHRRIVLTLVVLLHIAVVLAAVSVPGYALFDAVLGWLRSSGNGTPTAIVDVHRWLVLLGNTAIVCGVAVFTAILLGGLYGGLAARTDLPGRTLILAGAALGACTPLYVNAVFIFSLVSVSTFSKSALACGVIYGILYAPLATLVLAAVFRAGDRDLEEHALLDAKMSSVVARVTLPHARSGILALAALLLLLVATDHTISDILTVRTFAEEVYTQFQLHRAAGGPLITSIPLILALALLIGVLIRYYGLFGEGSLWSFGAPPPTIRLGRWRALLCLVLLLPPLALAVFVTRAVLGRIGSAEAFVSAAAPMMSEWYRSIGLAALGALVIVVFAVGLAWFGLRGGRGRGLVWGAAVILLAIPAPVTGVGLIEMLNRPGWLGAIYDSSLVLVIGYVVRFLPFGILLLLPAIQRVPLDLEQAARIDGCDWLARQWHVYWPSLLAYASVVWLLLVILCIGELGASALLARPGRETMSIRFSTLIHYGVYRPLAVLAILSIGGIVLPWLLLVITLRRKLAWSENR
jgi:iron(III) transport system permease protein